MVQIFAHKVYLRRVILLIKAIPWWRQRQTALLPAAHLCRKLNEVILKGVIKIVVVEIL
jgi:hypothetical protein